MADPRINDIDIFEDDRDYLDRAVGAYEENVPLAGQIAAGLTPAGPFIDVAETIKYGRDAASDFGGASRQDIKTGFANMLFGTNPYTGYAPTPDKVKSGAANTAISLAGIAGLVPLVGDIFKSSVKTSVKGLAKGIETPADATILPIDKIDYKTTTKGTGRGEDARRMLKSSADEVSYKGVKTEKRQPIEVLDKGDGRYEAIGGNTTLRVLKEEGTDDVPTHIFRSKEEYALYDAERKKNKLLIREQNANNLLPVVGSRTMEDLIRDVGGTKLEKAVAKQFNNTAHNFKSVDEMFETARSVNTNFQKNVDEIAQSLGFKTVGNPGETLMSQGVKVGEVDEITGHIAGQVKKPTRMLEKAELKYDNDVNQITDAIRTRILVNTTEEADRIAKEMGEKFPTIDSGNQVNAFGLRDRKLNILYTDPDTGATMIAEIGITTPEMHIAAEKAHKYYEGWRETMTQYKGQKIPAEMRNEVLNQENMMRYFFREADQTIDSSWMSKNVAIKPGTMKTPNYNQGLIQSAEQFALGGQVVGSGGRLSPMAPKILSNSGLESLSAFEDISAYTGPSPSRHPFSSPRMKKTSSKPASRLSEKTAGSPSQEKYNVSSVSMKDSIQNYKNKSIDKPLIGGRREIQ
jgi:ppGpp synthetase/RelA/SpoT-type nucleotidyltranferase